jgi:hypothetical protein
MYDDPAELTCPVCRVCYDERTRAPCVLDCGHTCCKRCITVSQHAEPGGRLRCFYCGRSSREATTNYALFSLLKASSTHEGKQQALHLTGWIQPDQLEVRGLSSRMGALAPLYFGLTGTREVAVEVLELPTASSNAHQVVTKEVEALKDSVSELIQNCRDAHYVSQLHGFTVKGTNMFCLVMHLYPQSLRTCVEELPEGEEERVVCVCV